MRSRLAAFTLVAVTVVSASGAAAQAGFDPHETGRGDGTLTIGQLAPQTGDLSSIVSSLTTPVTMAIGQINAAGGVLGRPVGYALADDGTQPGVAAQSLAQLLGGGADAIMGPASSGTMLGIIDNVRQARVPVCSGSNTSSDLSHPDAGGYYFRTAPSDRLQGRALAELVLKDHHKRIAVLERNDPENRVLGNPLVERLEQGGASILADVLFDPDAMSFDKYVAKVARAKPDAVVILGDQTDNDVVKTLIDKGLGPQQMAVYATDAMRTNTFAGTVDPNNPGAVAGIKGTSPAAAPTGVHNSFADTFRATGVQPIFSAHYYDCTILTALAAEKARSDDPTKIRNAFAASTKGKETCNTFADCKALVDAGKSIQYQGASAVFPRMNEFDTFEPTAGAYEVWVFDGTGQDVVEPTQEIRVGS